MALLTQVAVGVACTMLSNFGGTFVTGANYLVDLIHQICGENGGTDEFRDACEDAAAALIAESDGTLDKRDLRGALEILSRADLKPGQVVPEMLGVTTGPQAADRLIELLTPELTRARRAAQQTWKVDHAERVLRTLSAKLWDRRQALASTADTFQNLVLTALGPDLQPTLLIESDADVNKFSNRAIPVVGREEEQSTLRRFVFGEDVDGPDGLPPHLTDTSFWRSKNPFQWMQLAGDGGQGKSRLALELCMQVRPYVKAGFLEFRDYPFDKWGSWQPLRPTLIVIDYVVGIEDKIGAMLRALAHRAQEGTLGQHPIRVLLLERRAWNDPGILDTGDAAAAVPSQTAYAPWYSSVRRENSSNDGTPTDRARFPVAPGAPTGLLELRALTPDQLTGIVRDIAQKLTQTALPLPGDAAIRRTLEKIDKQGRPLYAYFLAAALAAGEDTAGWGRDKLLEAQLIRERTKRWPTNGGPAPGFQEGSAAADLAVVATIVRKVGVAEEEISTDGADLKNASRLLGHDPAGPVDALHGLQPDILGEFYVLFELEGEDRHQRNRRGHVVDHAAAKWSTQTVEFLARCAQDFPNHPSLPDLLEAAARDPKSAPGLAFAGIGITYHLGMANAGRAFRFLHTLSARIDTSGDPTTWQSLAASLFNAALAHGNAGDFPAMEAARAEIREAAKAFPEDREIRLEVAKAAVNAAMHYGDANDFPAMEAARDEIREAAKAFPDDREIRLEVAKAAANAAHYYGAAKDFPAMEAARDEFREAAKTFPEDREIRLEVANAAVNATNHYGAAKDFPAMEDARDDIREAAKAFPEDREIRLRLAQAAVNAAFHYDAAKDFPAMEDARDEIRQVAKTFPEDREIRLRVAQAAVNAAIHYGDAKDFPAMEDARDEIREAAKAFPEDREIRLEVAKAAANAAHYYGAAKDFPAMEDARDEIREAAKTFPEDREIRLRVAQAAVNAAIHYGAAKDFPAMEAARDEIREAAKAFPEDREIRLTVAKAAANAAHHYGAANDFPAMEAARDEIREAAKAFPNDPEIRDQFLRSEAAAAIYYAESDTPEKALAAWQRLRPSAADHPADPSVTYWVAWAALAVCGVYKSQDDKEGFAEAAAFIAQAVGAFPDHEGIARVGTHFAERYPDGG